MYNDRRRQASLLIFFVLLLAALAIAAPNFFIVSNFSDILINTSFIAIAALGMMCVIVIGQIDVSVGAILAICCTLAGLAAKAGYAPIPVVCGTMLVGALLGLLNGALIVGFGIHSIIVTLGTMSVFRGLLVYYTDGAWIYDIPPSFLSIGQGAPFGVPNPIWVMFLVFLVAGGVLRFTAAGRALYAVGSNQSAARLAGLNVPAVQVGAFVTNGALVGLAAIFFASRFAIIQTNTGIGFEFPVITAAVLGGASIFGGSGTALGTLMGALFVGTTGTALVFFHVSSFWEQAVQGLLVIPAVAVDTIRMSRWRLALWRRRLA